jgi:hypothetical protein
VINAAMGLGARKPVAAPTARTAAPVWLPAAAYRSTPRTSHGSKRSVAFARETALRFTPASKAPITTSGTGGRVGPTSNDAGDPSPIAVLFADRGRAVAPRAPGRPDGWASLSVVDRAMAMLSATAQDAALRISSRRSHRSDLSCCLSVRDLRPLYTNRPGGKRPA